MLQIQNKRDMQVHTEDELCICVYGHNSMKTILQILNKPNIRVHTGEKPFICVYEHNSVTNIIYYDCGHKYAS